MNDLVLSADLDVITAEINSYKQVAGQVNSDKKGRERDEQLAGYQ